jgi:quercetin dioxygenase-like cupin family protein
MGPKPNQEPVNYESVEFSMASGIQHKLHTHISFQYFVVFF